MALPKACRSLAGCDLLSLVLRMAGDPKYNPWVSARARALMAAGVGVPLLPLGLVPIHRWSSCAAVQVGHGRLRSGPSGQSEPQ